MAAAAREGEGTVLEDLEANRQEARLLRGLSVSQAQELSFLPVQGQEGSAPGRKNLMGKVGEWKGSGAVAHVAGDAGPE